MAKSDCSLIFTGTPPNDLDIQLAKDWNLIGWYSMNEALLGQESNVGNPLNVTPKNSLTSIYRYNTCLLYTSDAADDLLCVDLGGRRIIKKKKKNNITKHHHNLPT